MGDFRWEISDFKKAGAGISLETPYVVSYQLRVLVSAPGPALAWRTLTQAGMGRAVGAGGAAWKGWHGSRGFTPGFHMGGWQPSADAPGA